MKIKKLNLEDLKVKSFVTDLDKSQANTAKGGGETVGPCGTGWYCGTNGQGCKPPKVIKKDY